MEMRILVFSDSSSTRSLARRQGLGRIRHMSTRYLWVQERLRFGHFGQKSVPTDDNPADVLTKRLVATKLKAFCESLGQRWR
eukprot:9931399-Prorocentrum_lima.AAC.1